MSYQKRVILLAFIDSMIVLSSIYLSYYILIPNNRPVLAVAASSFVLLLCHHFFANRYKLYKRVWQYASIGELIGIFKGVTYSFLITASLQFIMVQDVFYRALLISWMFNMLVIGGVRFSWRLFRDTYIREKHSGNKKRVLIIGAGAAGTMVARQLRQNLDVDLYPVGFIDDDPRKQNMEILGLPVIGGREKIEETVQKLAIDNIIIAIPSLCRKELNLIVNECNKTKAKAKIVPMLEDLNDREGFDQ